MAVEVRQLVPADASAFQALRLQGLRECPSAFASSHHEEVDTPVGVVADRLAEHADRALFGAFAGPALVGVVGVQREATQKLAHKAFIWGVYVAPPARRTGSARKLLGAALAFATGWLGVRQANLSVHTEDTAAIALYRSLGFEAFGIEPACMCVDGRLQDEMHMACLLRP